MQIIKEIPLKDGRVIYVEIGKLAKQAHGSCVVRLNNTMVLATAVSATEGNPELDFMPLTVEYREKYSASGKIPGGFFKREARPFDHEILISRLIDRALRPMFPEDYHAETFVTVELISADGETTPESIAGLAASVALSISDIPFNGPISEVRVAKIDGNYVVNPNRSQLELATVDLVVGASEENIIMVEGECAEASEEEVIEAIKAAHEEIKVQCQIQKLLMKELNVKKREYCHEINDENIKNKLIQFCRDKFLETVKQHIQSKQERNKIYDKIFNDFLEYLSTEQEVTNEIRIMCKRYYKQLQKEVLREYYFTTNTRLDGRKMDEIRPIWCEVNYLPMAHGSAIFTRGETQSLTTVTLGTKLDEQQIDGVIEQTSEKFILHYNFPPYSTGDARPYRGVGRREIGHGNLALRALKRMIPSDPDVNPYTIRVVSDILESNGSSSMATVCAGTLALMDAGIKIKKPVSGIAMGLIYDDKTKRYLILSDILGDEDHLGNMDFKVCGTKDGITATQMDIKMEGLSYEILTKALYQAKEGRLFILNKMLEVISEPRPDLKPFAPRIVKMIIPKDQIGAVIGVGGKIIQEIQADTKTTIYIEPINDQGVVEISGNNKESIEAAIKRIKGIIGVLEIGEVYDATVKSITDYGAFVELFPGKEGLLHISEIQWERVKRVEDVLKVGQKIKVKLLGFDQLGRMKLSRKVLLSQKRD